MVILRFESKSPSLHCGKWELRSMVRRRRGQLVEWCGMEGRDGKNRGNCDVLWETDSWGWPSASDTPFRIECRVNPLQYITFLVCCLMCKHRLLGVWEAWWNRTSPLRAKYDVGGLDNWRGCEGKHRRALGGAESVRWPTARKETGTSVPQPKELNLGSNLNEKVGLKLNIQKTKIMAYGPIASWQIDGETAETVSDFVLLVSKITAGGDCSHEIRRCLLLGRKFVTNLDSLWKSRDITLPTKVCLVKAMVFPVVVYGCESWTIKKAEHQRIDAFELWCWRRLLRVPWTSRRSNQSILKENNPGCSLEGLMLKLKCQYFGHLMWRADSFEKTLMLGKIEGRRRRGRQRMTWLDDIIESMDMGLGGFWKLEMDKEAWRAAFHGVAKVRHDWETELNWKDFVVA